MRRTASVLQLLLVLFLLSKALFWLGLSFQIQGGELPVLTRQAEAETRSKEPPPVPDKAPKERLHQERALMQQLLSRQKDLEKQEAALKLEKERLALLRKELEERIASLKTQEESIKVMVERINSFESKAIRHLSQVFENTPPAKAGPMLEKLDTQTAAMITMNMKRDKAGAVWGHLSPQKAAEITNEIKSINSRSLVKP